MKHQGATAAAVIAMAVLVTGCSGGSSSSAPTTDWVGTWGAKVMHDTSTAHVDKYRPIAKQLCKGLKDGSISGDDLYNLPQSGGNMTPAQWLTFEFAAVKQYCPDQMSKMPVDDAPPS